MGLKARKLAGKKSSPACWRDLGKCALRQYRGGCHRGVGHHSVGHHPVASRQKGLTSLKIEWSMSEFSLKGVMKCLQ